MTFLGYIFPKIFPKKVTVVYLISSKFFCRPFFRDPHIFPHIHNKNSPAYYLFDFLDLTTDFLNFLDLKTVF